jgi:hypothetical protein
MAAQAPAQPKPMTITSTVASKDGIDEMGRGRADSSEGMGRGFLRVL